MAKSEAWAVILYWGVLALIVFGAMYNTNIQTEKVNMIQNHGTARITTPTYYVDPRTEKCFAMFVNGAVASVECDDLVKSLMANDWINKE